MKQQTIGFVGGGNMARALIGGLIADGFPARSIWVADVDPEKLDALKQQFGVQTSTDNSDTAVRCDILVLAVKPQMLAEVARDIAPAVQARRPLVISVAAGVRLAHLARWLGADLALVRCMPNTPAQVQTGATALYANSRTSKSQRESAESLLRAVGIAVWVEEEDLLDAVTALSGSGPAYFFLFMEAMENAAREMGLDAGIARLLTQQTALGAARIAIESTVPPEELRRRVTSPGGTTERAIDAFERGGLRQLVADAMRAAQQRSVEISNQFGGQ